VFAPDSERPSIPERPSILSMPRATDLPVSNERPTGAPPDRPSEIDRSAPASPDLPTAFDRPNSLERPIISDRPSAMDMPSAVFRLHPAGNPLKCAELVIWRHALEQLGDDLSFCLVGHFILLKPRPNGPSFFSGSQYFAAHSSGVIGRLSSGSPTGELRMTYCTPSSSPRAFSNRSTRSLMLILRTPLGRGNPPLSRRPLG